MMAVAQRLDRGLDDEIGGAEIGLADAEIDEVATLRGEQIGARFILSCFVTSTRHARRTIAGVRSLIDGAPTCCIMA